MSNGLWPIPERTPLNPAVFGRIERDEYSVEKVYFESLPGFFVTGNLYRPLDQTGQLPGILNLTVIGPTDGCRMTMPAPSPLGASASPGKVTWLFRTIWLVSSTAHRCRITRCRSKWRSIPSWTQAPPTNPRAPISAISYGVSACADFNFGTAYARLTSSSRCLTSIPARIGCTGASGGGTQTFC